MKINRISAFSHKNIGGNPAGVVICDDLPADETMLNIAKDVGYSETAFLTKLNDGWKIRYFAPEVEIPFCGHATIASTAVLGEHFGPGDYKLHLKDEQLKVSVHQSSEGNYVATLNSPQTYTEEAPREYIDKVLKTFNIDKDQLNPLFPVLFAYAGAKHLILVLKDRTALQNMSYEFETLKKQLQEQAVTTVSLLWQESQALFHARNPFPTGGIYEDAATGAAAAAFAGYLRDIEYAKESSFKIIQGEDMGLTSHLYVEYGSEIGSSVKVSGQTRRISQEG